MVNILQLQLQSGITLTILILQPYFPTKHAMSNCLRSGDKMKPEDQWSCKRSPDYYPGITTTVKPEKGEI